MVIFPAKMMTAAGNPCINECRVIAQALWEIVLVRPPAPPPNPHTNFMGNAHFFSVFERVKQSFYRAYY